jgi:hypothetical protein
VPGDRRARQVSGRNRPAVEHRDDADAVGWHLIDVQVGRRHVVLPPARRRDNVEERRVDAVCARRQERDLTAAFTLAAKKRLGILEVVARHLASKHALGRNRAAVGGDDERDLAGLHHDHRHLHDLVPPPPEPEVPSGRQHARLISRFAVERDDFARRERGTEALDHEASLVLGDHPGAQQHKQQHAEESHPAGDDCQRVRRRQYRHGVGVLSRKQPVSAASGQRCSRQANRCLANSFGNHEKRTPKLTIYVI